MIGNLNASTDEVQIEMGQQQDKTNSPKNTLEKGEVSLGKTESGFQPSFKRFESVSCVSRQRLDFRNISLTIKNKKILENINGSVDQNLCAILGPSGAGKSSLLNVLAGRLSTGKVEGQITINDIEVTPKIIRKNIAYVTQEDRLFATATARESLLFSAHLRLAANKTTEEKIAVVDELLNSLGLIHCADTFVGSELIRGLSGGERRRVSIGVEIITNPALLFLDEPTSGLDSYSALKVVQILKALSGAGCSVLCTIHQPNSHIFANFDKLLMLRAGKTVYNGLTENIVSVFDGQGFPIPANTNPADHAMHICQTAKEIVEYNIDSDPSAAKKSAQSAQRECKQALVQDYQKAGFSKQLKLLLIRGFLDLVRDKRATIGAMAIAAFLNTLVGIVFYKAGDYEDKDYDFRAHYAAVSFIFITSMFGAAQGPLLTFPLEKVVFLREHATGSYSPAAYLISKMFVELPTSFVKSIIIVNACYWLIGLQGDIFMFILKVFVHVSVSISYAVLVGTLAPDAKTAVELTPLIFVPQILFCGFFINMEQVPKVMQWVQYLCSLKFGLNLGMIEEFQESNCSDFPRSKECANVLKANDVSEDDEWVYFLVLVAIFVSFRLISVVLLARNSKY